MLKQYKKVIFAAALILMLIFTTLPFFLNQTIPEVNAQATSTVPNNMLQYEWLGVQYSGRSSHFSAGPAPDTANILWEKSVPGGASPIAFNGMLFITQGNKIVAIDPITGNTIYTASVPPHVPGRSNSVSSLMKIDATHMAAVSATGSKVNNTHNLPAEWTFCGFNTADGSLLWTMPNQIGPTSPGITIYDPDAKMIIVCVGNDTGRGGTQNPGAVQAWKLSDPTQPPTKAWTYIADGAPYGSLVVDDGKVFVGSCLLHEFCLDVESGELLWDTLLTGSPFYKGSYYNGVYYVGCLDNTFYALDGNTGNVLWSNRPSPFGFWCSGATAGYGMVYMTNVDGYFYAFNTTTGGIVWKYLGPGQYYPGYSKVADDKVYAVTGQGVASPLTGQGVCEFTCFDAFTGKVLWQVPREFGSGPSDTMAIAYGNLYAIDYITDPPGISRRVSPAPKIVDTVLICYGGVAATEDWEMYGGNPAHTAVSTISAPLNMAQEWVFNTNGAIISSPAVVDGKVFFGSEDRNWYCVDASTGAKIWDFKTGYLIRSSPAVVNGKVYTGADDGFVYCIDANTGSQLWKTPAPGEVIPIMTGTYPEWRSSPNVVNDRVYVGSLDGKLYCLDANSGNIAWAIQTTGAIMCNPTYIAGDGLYFASVDGFVYKVNPSNGNVIWNMSTPIGLEIAMQGSPCVANGMVVIGSGAAKNSPASRGQMYCFDAATGERLWTYTQQNYNATSPNLQMIWTPLYLDHDTLGPVFYFGDFYHFSCVNGTNGELIWTTYLTREHFGLPAYADNKIYIPADTFGIYVCDATTGVKLGYYDAGAQVRSSPAIYEGKIYFGGNNWQLHCVGYSSAGTTYYGSSSTPTNSLSPTATSMITQQPSASVSAQPGTFALSNELIIAIAVVVIVIIAAIAALVLRKRK